MKTGLLRSRGVHRLAVSALLLLGGCTAEDALTRELITVSLPSGWKPSEPAQPLWAGEPLATFQGPHSTLGFYRNLRVPGAGPENLARDQVTRLDNLPGYTIVSESTPSIGGHKAARVEAVAPGDGSSWAPSGLGTPILVEGQKSIATHRLSVGFPREADTVWVVCYYSDPAKARPEIDAVLDGLSIGVNPLKSSSY